MFFSSKFANKIVLDDLGSCITWVSIVLTKKKKVANNSENEIEKKKIEQIANIITYARTCSMFVHVFILNAFCRVWQELQNRPLHELFMRP